MRLPNGFGNVSKLPGNRRKPYRARVTVGWKYDEKTDDYKQQFKTIGYYETKQEGLIALSVYHQNPYDIDCSKITFREVFEKWSDEHFPKISPSNVKGYLAAYRTCEALEQMRFVDIRKSHLQGVIDDSGKNYPTMKKIRSLFSQLFKFAMQNDLCSKDYSKYVDIEQYRDKNPHAYNRTPFSKMEIQRVWDWKDTNEYFTVILILIYSGVRIGELLHLKKDCINLSERWFDITESKTKAGIRRVPISEKIVPFFEYWMNKNDCEYLLSTPDNKPFEYRNYYDSYWLPLINQMGMQHRPHDTRHTCISLLTVAGVQDKIIKKIVGHKGQSVTEVVYTHFEIQELIEAINKI
jgi:integrase